MFWRNRNSKSIPSKVNFPEILKRQDLDHRNSEFYETFFSLSEKSISEMNFDFIVQIYNATTLHEIRHRAIILLYNKPYENLLEFFRFAYKKERYLHMKILALRGLSQFISENEVEAILSKFNNSLIKRSINTPYNYIAYESLKGQNSLQYLVNRYNYKCYQQTLKIVQELYLEMPKAFKGHFTVDKNGKTLRLRSKEESSKMIDDFFKREGMR